MKVYTYMKTSKNSQSCAKDTTSINKNKLQSCAKGTTNIRKETLICAEGTIQPG